MNISQRLARLETPDFSGSQNYTTNRLPAVFPLTEIKPAKRFLRLLPEPEGDPGSSEKDRHAKAKQEKQNYKFLITKAGFKENNDDQWRVQRHLGSGSFGNVACWQKRNIDGEFEDEIAVKQMRRHPTLQSDSWDRRDASFALLKESLLQRQLNLSNSESKSIRP